MPTRFASALVIFLSIATALWMTARTRTDVDLWGHIMFGIDILQAREVHETDPYSFTNDRPWINHEWLSEIAMAAAWLTGGTIGLILLKLACTAGSLWLIDGALRVSGASGRSRVILLGLTLVGILPRIAQVRPQLFSVLLFAVLIRIFAHTDRGSTRGLLWTIPVMLLWANSHGGWLVGLGTVSLWCVGEAYARRGSRSERALPLACAAAAAAATLLNPYGVGLWLFLFETVGFGREAIREWQPAWTDSATMIIWLSFAAIVLAVLRRAPVRQWARNPASVVIPIAWGIASLRVGRLDAFFAMSVVGLMRAPVAALFDDRRDAPGLSRTWQVGAAVLALAVLLAVPATRAAFTCIGFYTPRWPEPDAVAFMRTHRLSGGVVTYFDWGEYGMWHMPEGLKVSMDGRRETVYTDRTVADHLELYRGTERGLSYLESLDADYVWLPQHLPVVSLLKIKGWVLLFQGPQSVLFATPEAARRTNANVGITLDRGAETGRCFPGP